MDQLKKMKIPQQWLDSNKICSKNKIDTDVFYEWYDDYEVEFKNKYENGLLFD